MPESESESESESAEVPAVQETLLRRMYDVFSTDERDAFIPRCLAPDVDWPNVADGVRLRCHKAVRAY